MKDKLEKLSKGKKLSPLEQKAKKGVLSALSKQAGGMIASRLKSKGESPDLAKLADAAIGKGPIGHEGRDPEEIVEGAEEELGRDLDNDDEEGESAEHKMMVLGGDESEDEDCSEEELEAKIQKLMELKKKKQAQQEE